eukprot:m.47783 g.47783  ORF g.47783 m.47783 type:complete len:188 (+) comp11000_c0_seq2:66-629(+)
MKLGTMAWLVRKSGQGLHLGLRAGYLAAGRPIGLAGVGQARFSSEVPSDASATSATEPAATVANSVRGAANGMLNSQLRVGNIKPNVGEGVSTLPARGREHTEGCVVCPYKNQIDYKNVKFLSQFVSKNTGEILGRRTTGVCAKMQRRIAKAIKRARHFGLLPHIYKDPRFANDGTVLDGAVHGGGR